MAEYDLGTARGRIELDASGVEAGAGKASASMDKMTGAQGRTAASMATTGAVVLSGAAAIGGGFALAINAAANFETRISAIAAVSGAAGDELEKVRAKALQLGADTKYSAGEAAGAMEELIKAGLSVSDVMNGAADATVNLAAAGEIDLTQAATIAANAMNQFGLAAADMPHIADLIAGAANASAIDVGQFGESMQQAGAVAHLVGLSFDDMAVAIAAMGNAGVVGSDAGTSLKSMLMRLQPQTQSQTDAMRNLGLITADGANKFFTAEGKIRSMSEIAGVLSDSLKGMSEQQKEATLQTIFGTDAIRAAAIIAETGQAGFDGLAESMGKISAADVAKTRMDNLQGSLEQLRGSVETLMIVIGRPLADILRVWVDHLVKLVNWFAQLDSSTLHTITVIAQVIGAFLTIIGTFLLVSAALEKLKIAWEAMSLAMETNPIILVITLLAALGYGLYQLYQNNETFRQSVQGAFKWIQDNVVPVIKTVIETFKQLVDAFAGGFQNPFASIGSSVDGPTAAFIRFGQVVRLLWEDIQAIASAFSEFWTVLSTGMTQNEGGSWWENLAFLIREVGSWMVWLVKEGIERLVSGFTWFYDNVWPVIFAFGELVAAVVGHVVDVLMTLEPLLTFIAALFQIGFDNIMRVVGLAVRFIERAWSLFGDNLVSAIVIAWGFIKNAVESALRIIQGIIQVVTSLIHGDWAGVWESIKNIFGGVWDYIAYLPGFVLDVIMLVIANALDAIHLVFSTAMDLLNTVITGGWESIKGIVVAGVHYVVDFIAGIPGMLEAFSMHLFDGLIESAGSAVQAVFDFFWNLPGRLLSLAGTIAGAGVDIAKSLLQGIIDGITGFVSFIGDFASGLGHAMIDWFNNNIIQWINDKIPDEITMPSEIPNINLPDDPIPWIPNPFHSGGVIPGSREVGITALGGEGVLSHNQMGWLASVLRSMGSSMPRFFSGDRPAFGAPGLQGAGSGNGAVIDLSLVFPNVGSAKDVEEIKQALGNQDVLSDLVRAIKTGVGAN